MSFLYHVSDDAHAAQTVLSIKDVVHTVRAARGSSGSEESCVPVSLEAALPVVVVPDCEQISNSHGGDVSRAEVSGDRC